MCLSKVKCALVNTWEGAGYGGRPFLWRKQTVLLYTNGDTADEVAAALSSEDETVAVEWFDGKASKLLGFLQEVPVKDRASVSVLIDQDSEDLDSPHLCPRPIEDVIAEVQKLQDPDE